MQIRQSDLLTLALGSIAVGLTSLAGAQSYTFSDNFGSSPHSYGLLNGGNLALYVSDRGDLGAPIRYESPPQKPMGIGTGSTGLNPIVNSGGSVPASSGTYAALYSASSTSGAGSLQASIEAKNEYVTIGTSVLEEYGVYVPGQNTWLHNGDFTAGTGTSALSVSGNIGGILTAKTQASNSANGITVGQTITIDDKSSDNRQNIAVFNVTVTNMSGASMNGVQYARVINPNLSSASTATMQQLGILQPTPAETNAFAIDASFSGAQLALGVDPTNSTINYNGTTIFSTTTTTENSLFNNLSNLITSSNRVVLGAGTMASYYTGGASTPVETQDYQDAIFKNSVDFNSNPIDDALVLLSPTYDLSSGQSFNFSFDYYFGPFTANTGDPTPEPGTWTLLAASLIGGAISARRRTARRQKPA